MNTQDFEKKKIKRVNEAMENMKLRIEEEKKHQERMYANNLNILSNPNNPKDPNNPNKSNK